MLGTKALRWCLTAWVLLALLLAGCARPDSAAQSDSNAGAVVPADFAAHAVIAHLDTGINPYHEEFRWASPLARLHPATWLPGYPADAVELPITLDASSLEEALERDADLWAGVERGTLYWIPGTRIVAAISFGPGGTYCPSVGAPPANQLDPTGACTERIILDDFGHGTMTASRMAGASHSLAPQALIASIEGPGMEAVRWASEAGFIDVMSNSWGELTPTATNQDEARALREAATHAFWVFASGNGLGFINGVAGQPTQLSPTFPPGVLIVGAHDNGYATSWHGAPPHVIADGYGGWRAEHRSLDGLAASPESCCTSAAAPYAAGGAVAIVHEARWLLGDSLVGGRGHPGPGLVLAQACADCPRPAAGVLADGNLTLGELRRVLEATAEARPLVSDAASDDGLVNWGAQPGSTPGDPWPGDNPYCVACFTSPVRLGDIPADQDLSASIGYGAVTRMSLEHAFVSLDGSALPERPTEDAFFERDEALRDLLYPR